VKHQVVPEKYEPVITECLVFKVGLLKHFLDIIFFMFFFSIFNFFREDFLEDLHEDDITIGMDAERYIEHKSQHGES